MKFNLSPQLLAAELFLFLFFTAYTIRAQLPEDNILDFTPSSFMSEISADGKLGFSKSEPGFGIREIRWNNSLFLANNIILGADVKSGINENDYWYEFNKRNTRLSELYIQYFHNFNLLKRDININIRAGKLEYYPSYTDLRLIIDNIDLFTNPAPYYGGMINTNIILDKKLNFGANLSANIGSFNSSFQSRITNAYLEFRPTFNKNFGLDVSAGKFEGTLYAFNEAAFKLNTKYKDIFQFTVKAGKLVGIDETPYGLQLGLEGYFKYVMLGASFERRLNQMNDVRYIVFYWRIINPPEATEFINSFNLIYDTNNDVLRFNIPFLTINFY